MIALIQAVSLILPQFWVNDTEPEDIADLVEHTSREFYCADVQEKTAHIVAIETVGVGAPGNIQWWVELSPVPSITSNAYWVAIGGGGGFVAPVAPNVIVGIGVDGATQADMINWVLHSAYARVVVQTPVNAGLPNDFWQVQVIISGKT